MTYIISHEVFIIVSLWIDQQIDISFFYFINKKNECQIFALNVFCFGVLFFLIAIEWVEINNYCRMLFSVYLNLNVLIIVRIGMRGYVKENQSYTTGNRLKKVTRATQSMAYPLA